MSDRSLQVAKVIRDAIISRRLVPGDKLTERIIVEALGVSRVVARQALIRLSEEGLVTWHANRGASVAMPDVAEIIALFDALTSVEQGVIDKLGTIVGTELWHRLRRHADAEKGIACDHGHDPEPDMTGNFHILLVSASRNRFIIEFHERLVRRCILLSTIYRLEETSTPLSHDHAKILDHIEGGKLAQAKALIARHYTSILSSYSEKVERTSTTSVREALLASPSPE